MDIGASREELIELGISEFMADNLIEKLNDTETLPDPVDRWQGIVREVLSPSIPFQVHQYLYEKVAADWPQENGPLPAWIPSVARQQSSNLAKVMERSGQSSYETFYQWSITEREMFWQTMISELGIRFKEEPKCICDLSKGNHQPRWLPGARLNIADSCFGADPNQAAIIYRERPNTGLQYVTYAELEKLANRVANGLVEAGFQAGDALAIDMIMSMESIAIYLGIVKAGCAVISIADSFTPGEIKTRLRIGEAKAIFTMDHIARGSRKLPMYAKVCEADPPMVIVLPGDGDLAVDLREGDIAWSDFLGDGEIFVSIDRDPHDTVNILFSSGTTGDPKAIPWNHTTPIRGATDGYLHHDIHSGDVVCWPTNLGWMMGPWLLFATLINRGTIALYYDAPTTEGFCAFVQDAGVQVLGVVPSLVKAWRHSEAIEEHDWTNIQAFSSTGECSAPGDMLYLMSRANYQPVIEYCGGTEIGGGYVSGTVIQPAAPSTFTTPTFGMELALLDEASQPTDNGELFIVPPSIGLSVTLLNKDHDEQYYEGAPKDEQGRQLRRHGDQVEKLPGGFWRAHGRADDTMNLGGIKVGSAEIERTLKPIPGVDETAAIAISPPDGGPSQLVVFATLHQSIPIEALKTQMQQAIRTDLNPLFKIHDVVIVETLPRTASGKVMRRLLRKQYQSP